MCISSFNLIKNRFRLFRPRLLHGKSRMNASGPATGNPLSVSGTDAAFFLEITVEGRQVREARLRGFRRLQGRRQVRDDHPPFYFSAPVDSVFDFYAFHGL
jgi:hypothetical protein